MRRYIGTVLVPRAGHFHYENINIFLEIKYTEAVLSNSTRKLLWLEITKNANCTGKKMHLLCRLLLFSADFRNSFPIAWRGRVYDGSRFNRTLMASVVGRFSGAAVRCGRPRLSLVIKPRGRPSKAPTPRPGRLAYTV